MLGPKMYPMLMAEKMILKPVERFVSSAISDIIALLITISPIQKSH